MRLYTSLDDIKVLAPVKSVAEYTPSSTAQSDVLTKSSLTFVALLHKTFNQRRVELLESRLKVQQDLDNGKKLKFLDDPELVRIRQDPTWKGAPLAPGLIDRRVEITGPPKRNMVVNALNTPVKTYMTDFEDSLAPTWANIVDGQLHLFDANRGQIDFKNEATGKEYKVNKQEGRHIPTLIVRPRGWHMVEKHVTVSGEPISASIFDFGLYFFHNAKQLIANGRGPYFYLPKMESHLEARLWNDIFNVAQDLLEIPRGTIRATVLIETLPAAYQMEEIIYELRDHSAGLNCGRWDYIFSTIKRLKNDPTKILPDRGQVTMTSPFMKAYCERLINICHRRQVHAMGGMAAQIPIKDDKEKNDIAMANVSRDKLREATMGYDGTWIASPAIYPYAIDIFDDHMPTPNQIYNITEESVTEDDLSNTKIEGGAITETGIRQNLYIGLNYMEAWARGNGCVPISNLMEDAATAEVSRLQLYSWVKHGVKLVDTQETVTPELMTRILNEETEKLIKSAPANNKFQVVSDILKPEIRGESISEFLTTLIYDEVTTIGDPIDLQQLKD